MKAKRVMTILIAALFAVFLVSGNAVSALAIDTVTLPTEVYGENVISVDLPTIGEESPFDFFIDPQGLIYETSAAKYGGGTVEEGASLLFHNYKNKDFDFSSYSDSLKVINRSTVPVVVRVTAKITDLGDIKLEQDDAFEGEESNAIYLAVVDDEGNERPLSGDGEVILEAEMKEAPAEAYTYYYNEEQDVYEYVSTDKENMDYDTYSFGLRGECNTNADWSELSVSPKVIVTWEVEPVTSEKEEYSENDSMEDRKENFDEDPNENDTDKEIYVEDEDDISGVDSSLGDESNAEEKGDTSDAEMILDDAADKMPETKDILSVSNDQVENGKPESDGETVR